MYETLSSESPKLVPMDLGQLRACSNPPWITLQPIAGLVQCWVDERSSAAEALQLLGNATLELDAQVHKRNHTHNRMHMCT